VPIGAWVHLELDEESWMSQFRIRSGSAGAYAVFADHPPTEFNGFPYKDKQGNAVEPAAEEAGDHKGDPGAATTASTDDHGRMGQVLLGSAIVAPAGRHPACHGRDDC
jgi:hypothetical protein